MGVVTREEILARMQRVENALRQKTLESFRAALEDVDRRDLAIVRRAIERQWTGRKQRIFCDAISEEVIRRRTL